jgi:hypothetical protein
MPAGMPWQMVCKKSGRLLSDLQDQLAAKVAAFAYLHGLGHLCQGINGNLRQPHGTLAH